MDARIPLLSAFLLGCQAHIHAEAWTPAVTTTHADFAPSASVTRAITELPEAPPEPPPAAPVAAPVAAPAPTARPAPVVALAPTARHAPEAGVKPKRPAVAAVLPTPAPTPPAPAPGPDVDASRAEARSIFTARCSVCHGASGQGNGPASASLTPKPRDFTNAAWHGTITDGRIEETILKGGAAMGKSPLMPANPDLADKPQVLKSLRAIVRSLRG